MADDLDGISCSHHGPNELGAGPAVIIDINDRRIFSKLSPLSTKVPGKRVYAPHWNIRGCRGDAICRTAIASCVRGRYRLSFICPGCGTLVLNIQPTSNIGLQAQLPGSQRHSLRARSVGVFDNHDLKVAGGALSRCHFDRGL
jgi:hypothetical protein